MSLTQFPSAFDNLSGSQDRQHPSLASVLNALEAAIGTTTAPVLAPISHAPAVTPQDHGAYADGIHDDTAAVQAAINQVEATGEGTVLFPLGIYLVQIPQITGSNVTCQGLGPGSIIRLAPSSIMATGHTIGIWCNGATNIVIRDLAFDGNFLNIAKDGGAILPSTFAGAGVTLNGAIVTTPAAGTTETWTVSTGAATASNAYTNIPFIFQVDTELIICTGGQGTTSWTVRRGFSNSTVATHLTSAPIISSHASGLFDSTITSYGIWGPKNYYSSTYAAGVDASTYLQQRMPVRASNSHNILVVNCTIYNSISAGILSDATSVNGCQDIRAMGNRIHHTWDNGVYFHMGVQYGLAYGNDISDSMYNGVSAVYCDHVLVQGNIIRYIGPSLSDSGGTQINGSSNCSVVGNMYDHCNFYGVEALSTQETNITGGAGGNQVWASNTIIAANTCTNCRAPDYPTHNCPGINLSGATDTNIFGNSVSGCDFGVSIGQYAVNTVISGNRITNNAQLGVNINNRADIWNVTVRGNLIANNGSHGATSGIPSVRYEGNTITGNAQAGINLGTPPTGIASKIDYVIGNTLTDNGDSGVQTFQGANSLAVIERNTFGNTLGTRFTDGQITFGSPNLYTTTAAFTAADVGKTIIILNQGAGGTTLVTTIVSAPNGGQAVLAANAGATQTGTTFIVMRGPVFFTGSTAAGANSVLTAPAGTFVSTDAGLRITVFSTDPIPILLFSGTIQTYTSATQVSLSGNAGTVAAVNFIIQRIVTGEQGKGINNYSGYPIIERNNLHIGGPEIQNAAGVQNLLMVDRTCVNDANFTCHYWDRFVAFTALTAARTVTLADATTLAGKIITVKDEAGTCSATNTITLGTTASQTIDGAATKVINTAYATQKVYSNGAQWMTT